MPSARRSQIVLYGITHDVLAKATRMDADVRIRGRPGRRGSAQGGSSIGWGPTSASHQDTENLAYVRDGGPCCLIADFQCQIGHMHCIQHILSDMYYMEALQIGTHSMNSLISWKESN